MDNPIFIILILAIVFLLVVVFLLVRQLKAKSGVEYSAEQKLPPVSKARGEQTAEVVVEAKALMKQGELDQAQSLLANHIAMQPHRVDLRLLQLAIFAKQDNPQSFEIAYDQLGRLDDSGALAKANQMRARMTPSDNELPVEKMLGAAKSAEQAQAATHTDASDEFDTDLESFDDDFGGEDFDATTQANQSRSLAELESLDFETLTASEEPPVLEAGDDELTLGADDATSTSQATLPELSFEDMDDSDFVDNSISTLEAAPDSKQAQAITGDTGSSTISDDAFSELSFEDDFADQGEPSEGGVNEFDTEFAQLTDEVESTQGDAVLELTDDIDFSIDNTPEEELAELETEITSASLRPVTFEDLENYEKEQSAQAQPAPEQPLAPSTEADANVGANDDHVIEFDFSDDSLTDTNLDGGSDNTVEDADSANLDDNIISLDDADFATPSLDTSSLNDAGLNAPTPEQENITLDDGDASNLEAPADITADLSTTPSGGSETDDFAIEFDAPTADKTTDVVADNATGIASEPGAEEDDFFSQLDNLDSLDGLGGLDNPEGLDNLDTTDNALADNTPSLVIDSGKEQAADLEIPSLEESGLETSGLENKNPEVDTGVNAELANDLAINTATADESAFAIDPLTTVDSASLAQPTAATDIQDGLSITDATEEQTITEVGAFDFDTPEADEANFDAVKFDAKDANLAVTESTDNAAGSADATLDASLDSEQNQALLEQLKQTFSFVGDIDNNQTNLDLASSYIHLGEYVSAKSLLQEVITHGNIEQKSEAQRLMESLS